MLVAAVLLLLLLSLLAAAASYRLYSLLPSTQLRRSGPPVPRKRTGPCRTAILLGSGGHTAELLQLASSLPAERYAPRSYVISAGDGFSADKAHAAERARREGAGGEAPEYSVYTLPRARAVHQSFVTAPLSVLLSLVGCVRLLVLPVVGQRVGWRIPGTGATPLPELILLNGPGTCVPVVVAVYILRVSSVRSAGLGQRASSSSGAASRHADTPSRSSSLCLLPHYST